MKFSLVSFVEKLKLSHYTPQRPLRGEKVYSFSTSALYGVGGQRHAPAAL
jgi:hypothetical protein